MNFFTYISLMTVLILGVSCSSCKNSKNSSEAAVEEEVLDPNAVLAKKKKLPPGTVLVNLKFDQSEFDTASEQMNFQVTKVLRRGQESPIISNDEKLRIEVSSEQKNLIKSLNEKSEVLLKIMRKDKNNNHQQLWQII